MSKFRKKPVVVEAVQWFHMGDHPRVVEGAKLDDGSVYPRPSGPAKCAYAPVAAIKTLEGWYEVTPGDWIITGVAGEHYPCKDEIFRQTYEPVEG